ncbi:MAG: T9SS type A sorting domain-containing protein [Bacteroidetes bacterium]|nr:T9SS type A sorting domain-containing protein [Bacteroidota bacterium]
MIKIVFSFLIFTFSFSTVFSQETVRVLQYNLLYYGTYPSFCPVEVNDPDLKEGYLKTIIDYVQPDVFCVNELGDGNTYAGRILDNVINSDNPGKFKRGVSTNNGFSSIVNMLYYNSEKLILYSQEQVSKDLNNDNLARIIDLYTLYFNDANLSQTNDTIFITFIVAHLKAGSSSSDQLRRELETAALMKLLENKDMPSNIIFSGDFNVRSSNENSFQNLINYTNPLIRFYDPINQLGTWYGNTNYSNIHTQATRITGQTNGGCFAGGGSDDRFDFILISQAIKDNLLKVQYLTDSYTVPGQDGNRFNQSLIDPPNFSAPANVITALYEMSDHYPVYLDLNVELVLNNVKIKREEAEIIFKNPIADFLDLHVKWINCQSLSIEIINLTGSIILRENINGENGSYYYNANISGFAPGMYLIKISNKEGIYFSRKMLKQ